MIEQVKRLTPNMVVEAYRQINGVPFRGEYFSHFDNQNRPCVCGMGAYALATAGFSDDYDEDDYNTYVDSVVSDVLPHTYITGFAVGFDGKDKSAIDTSLADEMYTDQDKQVAYDAYEDGVAAWEAVKDLPQNE